ncbi:hypothetical protein PV326_008336 [Microctonus aethiopoides]|nr:hypothetical protein PV326_008336 [Microctonus aethiopoides]
MKLFSIEGTEMLTTIQVPTTTSISSTTIHQVPIVETSSETTTTTSTHISSSVPDVNLNSIPTTMSKQQTTTSTTTPSTTTATILRKITTANVVHSVPNHPPTRDRQLQKIPVTAGKPLSYIIPANTFSDAEDGNTRNLTLDVFHQHNRLNITHWLQFNNKTQEEDVSIWDYEVIATDRQGLSVIDNLKIYVQQHKLSRAITHEFSIYIQIGKRKLFPTNIDWALKIIRSLAQLYGDNDANAITVRSIDINGDQAIFTWTNDSIPRSSECPKDEINKLLHVLIANRDGDPSAMLEEILAPEIHVRRVVFQGMGQCETMNEPDTPKIPTQEPKTNFPPLPRNQVDHINATVGQLLVFRVPEDTFFDPEDGSARNMRMSLLTIDRNPIPGDDWLQFDINNQEFYGVPMKNDIKRKEYQLVVTDKDGASATDGLVVVVHPSIDTKSSAEFTIKLGTDYDIFMQSAMLKKNFIHRLRDLFGDKDTNAISITSILPAGKNTIITWRNTTLPTDYCPNNEITRLSEVLFVKPDNKELTDRIERIMGSEFPIDQLTLTPMGICQGEFTRVHSNDNGISTSDDSTSVDGASNDDYLITFVLPAIIIAAMLIFAGIIACVLYRRKRSGKMSVSEHDDERQSFRSKGIPVIFQDELEEKPDPGNKSPVILKEEKPPLPPPEYQKGAEDGADQPMLPKENSEEPYQPPPPFARTSDNNRQNRPKPTPTYRKPPPYVPP